MPLNARRREVGEWTVVELIGRADLSTVPSLQRLLREALGQGPRLVVDLDEVELLDGPALGVLLDEARRARMAGGDLRVVSTAPATRERLAASRFDRAVEVHAAVTDATAGPLDGNPAAGRA